MEKIKVTAPEVSPPRRAGNLTGETGTAHPARLAQPGQAGRIPKIQLEGDSGKWPARPAVQAQPARSAAPEPQVWPVNTTLPAKQVQPVNDTRPVQQTPPVESALLQTQAQPVKSVRPQQPAQPARTALPTLPPQAVQSAAPAEPEANGANRHLGENIRAAMIDNGDAKESLKTIRSLLVGPAQRVTEARLDEILTILEEVDRASEERTNTLARHVDEMAATINPMIERSARELSGRVAALTRKVDDLRAAANKDTDVKLAGLAKRVNDSMHGTFRELGMAIAAAGKTGM